jgi:hypothetical protein
VRFLRHPEFGTRFGERPVNAGGSAVHDHETGAVPAHEPVDYRLG